MNFGNTVRTLVRTMALGAVLTAGIVAAHAEDKITDAHLKAAHAAINAIHATDLFDVILPGAAQALKADLIQRDPNFEQLIVKTVDQKAIDMVGRRADLEKEAALAYAKTFTEDELNAIAAFYNTDAGKKLIANGPVVTRQLAQAAEIWQRGIARDLSQSVGDALKAEGVDKSGAPGHDPATASGNQ